METTRQASRRLRAANCSQCLPSGSGSPDEWKQIEIDTTGVPSLTYEYLNGCSFRIKNPSPIDANLLLDPHIAKLNGVYKLRDILRENYQIDLNFTSLGLWSTIGSEMNLVRTKATINYTDHYANWVDLVVSNRSDGSVITMFDLYEQVAVLGYRDRVVDEANYIQTGTILTSLIESQRVALGLEATKERMKKYRGKRMIFYSTHDSVLQLMLFHLGIVRFEPGSFEARFDRWHKNELDMFLNGLKMSSFGSSVRFELYEIEMAGGGEKFPFVQVSIYFKEDGNFQDVHYEPVQFGSMCRQAFNRKYPNSTAADLARFYPKNQAIKLNHKLSCPFQLLTNLTASLIVDEQKLSELCD